jgi:hypothetical protein
VLVRGPDTAADPASEWDRRLSFRDLQMNPALRVQLERFWKRQFARELARLERDGPSPERDDLDLVAQALLADLPEDLARRAQAEGGDRVAVDRARRDEISRPIRARVETGVFKGNAARYEKGLDEAVLIDDVRPGRTERSPIGVAWLDAAGATSGAVATGVRPAGAGDLDGARTLASVSLPRDRRRAFGDVDQPEATGGLCL